MAVDGLTAVCSRTFSAHEVLRAELLRVAPNVRFNDAGISLKGDALVEFLTGTTAAVIALERIDGALLDALPNLRTVSKFGVGTDRLDLDALAARDVRLGWTPGVNRRSVAELVISFAISLLRMVPQARAEIEGGGWRRFIGRELSGSTVGILGLGNVGQDVVRMLAPFGCRVLACDIRDRSRFAAQHGVEMVELPALFDASDVITIHVPLDGTSRDLVGPGLLDRTKPGAVLVNLARGGIVDESAVLQALDEGRLAAAAFDVYATEPPRDLSFVGHPRVLATPHIGGSSAEAILGMGRAAIRGLQSARLVSEIDFHEVP